ncbi:hypothetical protein [Clostridium folliculivorans]|uniref:hypothetical protein n=1 Tax=Clostridium folliculivorans TaxID=2886038 RepID=UPI0021C438E6|nr:hypothetical protein [Clostridium folliculivorans]GKU29316.1 hypothetical protein CFB3_14220 [Clostridium folliculivorans]
MFNSTEIGYIFKKDEIIALAAMLGNREIMGIDDEELLYKNDENELRKRWKRASKQLEEKGYVKLQNEEIIVDSILAYLINCCCKPNFFIKCIQKYSKEKKVDISVIVSQNMIVTIEPDRTDKDCVILTPIEDFDALALKILDNLDFFQSEGDFNNVNIKFNKQQYYSFNSAVNLKNTQKIVNLLMLSGMEDYNAEKLAESFIDKDNFITVSLTNILSEKAELIDAMMVVAGEKIYYLISSHTNQDEIMKIRQISQEECKKLIQNFFLRLKG